MKRYTPSRGKILLAVLVLARSLLNARGRVSIGCRRSCCHSRILCIYVYLHINQITRIALPAGFETGIYSIAFASPGACKGMRSISVIWVAARVCDHTSIALYRLVSIVWGMGQSISWFCDAAASWQRAAITVACPKKCNRQLYHWGL